ncbi:hypothetical protein PCIT_a3105 [Pseudoalteromonas citrea]|uniref:Uncharacterized protein n=1 Tax=Pseudoalteromonas citrea TaxID=43655 RepID=A0AAD4FRQ8_9GAMM|nr:hypothetical protein PCIT_a3105 [Pseudoalteromonas citrea]
MILEGLMTLGYYSTLHLREMFSLAQLLVVNHIFMSPICC